MFLGIKIIRDYSALVDFDNYFNEVTKCCLSFLDESKSSSGKSSRKSSAAYLHVNAPLEVPSNQGSILACLAPQAQHLDSTMQMSENILLHHFFGINDFFIYDHGITGQFLENFVKPPFNTLMINVGILPWNIPNVELSNDVQRQIIDSDCFFRSKARKFKTSVVLNLTQILVPRSGETSLPKALEQSQKSGQLLVELLKFCSEYPVQKSPVAQGSIKAAYEQSVYNKDLSQGQYIKVTHGSSGEQGKVNHDELAVHDYGPCKNYDMDVDGVESIRDRTIARQMSAIEKFLRNGFLKV